MMRVIDPGRLARRRLLALKCQVPQALAGVVEGVHQARVASRRLREFLPLLATASGQDRGDRQLRAQVRCLTRGLGPVRELDVALINLDDVQAGHPELSAAVEVVRAVVSDERAAAFDRMVRAVSAVALDKLQHRIGLAADGLADPASRRRIAAVLAARIGERGAALQLAVDNAGILYAPDRLHRVRIATKKFRYALELAEEGARFRLGGTLGRLKCLQDTLGTLHDDEVLASKVRDCGADSADPAGQRALTALARHLDEAVRLRHSEFLRARASLNLVFFWARRVRLGLAGPAVRMTRSAGARAAKTAAAPLKVAS